MMRVCLNPVLFAVVLNLVLPMILSPYATDEEVKPKNGAASLSLKGQFMHMMVHHNQVMFSSSLIVGLIVFLACLMAKYYPLI
tara:strand:+ start:457 stop:705 length:249 start_codon:yes stop_codon:yes gene_type:complete